MKKINLFALLAMLFSVTLFVSCSSDDDETKDDDEIIDGLEKITVNNEQWFVENDEGYYYEYGDNKLSEFYTYIKETVDFGDLGYMLSLTAPAKNELVKGFSVSDYYSTVGFSKPVQLRAKTMLTGNFEYAYVDGTAVIAEVTAEYVIVEFNNFKIYNSNIQEESYNHKKQYIISGKMKFQFQ